MSNIWMINCDLTPIFYASREAAFEALTDLVNQKCYGIYTIPSVEEMIDELNYSYGACKRNNQSEFGISGTDFWASKIEVKGEEEVSFIWKVYFNDGHTYERYTDCAEMAQRIMEEYLLDQGRPYWQLTNEQINKKLDEIAVSRQEDETYFGCTFDDFTSICSAERIALN